MQQQGKPNKRRGSSQKKAKRKGRRVKIARQPTQNFQQQQPRHISSVVRRLEGHSASSETAKRLAMAIALPSAATSLRLPTVDCPRSSICTLIDTVSAKTPTVGFTERGFDPNTMLVALVGQPGRSLMMWQSGLNSGAEYELKFGSFLVDRWQIGLNDNLLRSEDFWPLVGARLINLASAPIHGITMPVATTSHGNFIYMNTGDNLLIDSNGQQTFNNLTGNLTFSILRWHSPNAEPSIVNTKTTPVDGGVVPLANLHPCTSAGYYAVHFTDLQVTSGLAGENPWTHALRIRLQCTAANGWRMYNHSDFDPNAGGDVSLLSDCRFNSAALLISNVTAEINKSGMVMAARIRGTDPVQLNEDDFQRSAEKYTGQAANGVYTFKEFTQEASEFKGALVRSTGGTLYYPTFNLDMEDFFHYIMITGVESLQNNFQVTITTTVEFKNDTSRYQKDISPYDYHALLAARRIIASNPEWFYENPLHVADIYRFVKSKLDQGGRFLVKHSGAISTAVGAIAPELALPASLAAQAIKALYG